METPQLENGFTRIANQLLEQYSKIRIPGECMQVLFVIIRKTYGYNKKHDAISLSQFVSSTNLKKTTVCKAIKKLHDMCLIAITKNITKKGNSFSTTYCVVKNSAIWKPLPKKVTLPKKVIIVTQKGKGVVPNMVHTKDNVTKDNKDILPSTTVSGVVTKAVKGKTPLQQVMDEYLTIKKIAKDVWGVQYRMHCKCVSTCLKSLGLPTMAENVEKFIAEIKLAEKFYAAKKLNWTIETVAKNFGHHQDREMIYQEF